MKLVHFFFLLSLLTFSLIKTEDWSHNDDYSLENDNEEEGVKRVGENYDIGIALSWLPVSRYNLAAIPINILVSAFKEPNYYVCRVPINGGRIKIVGKLHYPSKVCIIPTTKLESMSHTVLSSLAKEKHSTNFEIMTNPLHLNLMYVFTSPRQGTTFKEDDRIIPARPVLAELPRTSGSVKGRRAYSPPFIANIISWFKGRRVDSYMGVVQEVSENGTLAFYYGLVNVQEISFINVLTVLNTKKPAKYLSVIG